VVIDEADTFKHSKALKGLITNDETRCEKKGIQPYKVSNLAGIVFLTNEKVPVKIECDDRRYFTYDCSTKHKNDKVFWDYFYNTWSENTANQKAVYDYLMAVDISNVDWISDRPKNASYDEIRGCALPIEIKFISHLIVYAFPPLTNGKLPASELYTLFEQYTSHRSCEITQAVFGKRIVDVLKKGCVFSNGDTRNAFHKTRGKTGYQWEINRELAFEWLKNSNYTTAVELTEICDDIEGYSFIDTL